jgi:hypothetical protein
VERIEVEGVADPASAPLASAPAEGLLQIGGLRCPTELETLSGSGGG